MVKIKQLLLYFCLLIIILISTIPLVHANFWQPDLPQDIFNLIKNLIISYLITVIIEGLIIRALFQTFSKELFFTILFINFITNPTMQIILWTFYFFYFFNSLLILTLTIIILEFSAVYIEYTLLFDKIQKKEVEFDIHFMPINEKRYVLKTVILANLVTAILIIFPLMIYPPIFLM